MYVQALSAQEPPEEALRRDECVAGRLLAERGGERHAVHNKPNSKDYIV